MRPGLSALVEKLSVIDGLDDIAMTTNGVLLPRHAVDLRNAGLGRITVSLDSLDEGVLQVMSGGKGKLAEILAGIEAAVSAGFNHLKINLRGAARRERPHRAGPAGAFPWQRPYRAPDPSTWTWATPITGKPARWCPRASGCSAFPNAGRLNPWRPAGIETAKRYRFVDGAGKSD